jgi:hypothetical protein
MFLSAGDRVGRHRPTNPLLYAPEVSLPSAATVDLTAGWPRYAITGTTTITKLRMNAWQFAIVRFTGALTLTYNATSLILPGAASITTAAGDYGEFIADGSGNVTCLDYNPASGKAVVSGAGATFAQIAQTSISGTPSTESYTSLTSEDILVEFNNVAHSATTVLSMKLSTNNGGAYNTFGDIVASQAGNWYAFVLLLGCKSGDMQAFSSNTAFTGVGQQRASSGSWPTASPYNQYFAGLGTPINALQFLPGSGTFTSGTITLYGRG